MDTSVLTIATAAGALTSVLGQVAKVGEETNSEICVVQVIDDGQGRTMRHAIHAAHALYGIKIPLLQHGRLHGTYIVNQ